MVKDLITGKIKLNDSPYPCHEKRCLCGAHLIGLNDFRKKHKLSKYFVDSYDDHIYEELLVNMGGWHKSILRLKANVLNLHR